MALRTKHLFFGAFVAGVVGCVGIPPEGKKPILANHVEDWRDEVIYQILVDRFADGDVNNNYMVRPGPLARYQGGDWKGIEEHLDYLQELGVTTLWISPIVRNVETDADFDAYHGYWAQDLTQLNPHFGDIASLRSLSSALHNRGMKIVLDIVTNHMGQVFFYDLNLNGKPDIYIGGSGTPLPGDESIPPRGFPNPTGHTSTITRSTEYDPDFDGRGPQVLTSLGRSGRAPVVFIDDPSINRVPPQPGILGRREGYHALGRTVNYDVFEQLRLGDFPGGLKDVNTENPEVRATMIDVFAKWAEDVDFDGFRIDTVKHVEYEFWRVFSRGIRERLHPQGKTNFLMFGEAFDGNDTLLGSFTKKDDGLRETDPVTGKEKEKEAGELDSVFYFSQHYQVFRDVFQNAHDAKKRRPTSQIEKLWSARPTLYGTEPHALGANVPPHKAVVNFMDNHDVARFLFFADGDREALRNALSLLLTEEGIPCIYYGTELDFAGGNDPGNREVMWTSGFPTTGDTFLHVKKLLRLRKAYPALRRGDLAVRFSTDHVADEEDSGMFAFERAGGDAGAGAYALVVMNAHPTKAGVTAKGAAAMAVGVPVGTVLVDVLDPQQPTYTVDGAGALRLNVPAQRAMILVPQDQVKAL